MSGWVRVEVSCLSCAWKANLPTLEDPQTFGNRLYWRHLLHEHPTQIPSITITPAPPVPPK